MLRSKLTFATSLFALCANAAEPTLKGADRVTIDYLVASISSLGPEHRDDPIRVRVEFSGVSHDEAGLFDGLGWRCVGVSELAGDTGECVARDAAGDHVVFAYAIPAPGGQLGSSHATVTGGAGKFAGLTMRVDGEAAPPSSQGLPLFFPPGRLVWALTPPGAQVVAAPDRGAK